MSWSAGAAGREGYQFAAVEASAIGEQTGCHAFLQPVSDYWDNLRGDLPMPHRDDLDPVAIGRFLPYVLLVEVLKNPLDFRFRICGEHFISNTGSNPTNARLREIAGDWGIGEVMFDAFEIVVEAERPRTLEIQYRTMRGTPRIASNLILPFADNHKTVGSLLIGVVFE